MRKDKTMNAYEWGVKYRSCREALQEREKLGPDKKQSDWYLVCDRGDWLLWQLNKLSPKIEARIKPNLDKAIEVIVTRAVRKYALPEPSTHDWAEKWLNGEDRSRRAAARAAAWAAWAAAWAAEEARAAAWAEELRQQASDIHLFIPEWPGEKEKE
jgi:hypothetical protein